jgi:hypothetical protein
MRELQAAKAVLVEAALTLDEVLRRRAEVDEVRRRERAVDLRVDLGAGSGIGGGA